MSFQALSIKSLAKFKAYYVLLVDFINAIASSIIFLSLVLSVKISNNFFLFCLFKLL